jgi:hypothetical protein
MSTLWKGAVVAVAGGFVGGYVAGLIGKQSWANVAGTAVGGAAVAYLLSKF